MLESLNMKYIFCSHSKITCLLLFLIVFYKAGAQNGKDKLVNSINAAQFEIWNRFVNKQNYILYDYTDSNGSVYIPTKTEVLKLIPNGLSYRTVIEDGAFYNGIYLDGLCERWKALKSDDAKQDAKNIARGLVKLAQVSKVPGFIARNVLPDGQSYYPASSDDQTFPWFYGLWKYIQSGIPESAEIDEIKNLIVDKATALYGYGWEIPCDPISFGIYGSFSKPNSKHLVRIPFINRIVYEITGDEKWNERYLASLSEIPPGEDDNRLSKLEQGIPYGEPGKNKYRFWLTASSQGALKELIEMEDNQVIKNSYINGLRQNALSAVEHLQEYVKFDNENNLTFKIDWRYLNDLWRPQENSKEAREVGFEQIYKSYESSPREKYEFTYMTEPLFAAWVIVLSGDKEIIKSVEPDIRQLLTHYNWSELYTAPFFVTQSIYYLGIKYIDGFN